MSQHAKIINLLDDGQWHCTSEMRNLYMADPPKRICELKEKGFIFDNPRVCTKHNYHDGGVKEWRLLGKPTQNSAPQQLIKKLADLSPIAQQFIKKFCQPKEKEIIKTLF